MTTSRTNCPLGKEAWTGSLALTTFIHPVGRKTNEVSMAHSYMNSSFCRPFPVILEDS